MDAVKTPREEAGDWVPSATEIIKGSTATSPDTPRSRFRTECHPLVQQISYEVDEYFLLHWPFPDLRSRHKFVAAGFSRVTCLYFPLSKNNRIGYACRLLTVLFLIDGKPSMRSAKENLTEYKIYLRTCHLMMVPHIIRSSCHLPEVQ